MSRRCKLKFCCGALPQTRVQSELQRGRAQNRELRLSAKCLLKRVHSEKSAIEIFSRKMGLLRTNSLLLGQQALAGSERGPIEATLLATLASWAAIEAIEAIEATRLPAITPAPLRLYARRLHQVPPRSLSHKTGVRS